MRPFSFLLAAFLILLGSCADDVQSLYSRYKASFVFYQLATAPPLNGAIGGYGEYCDIRYDSQRYYFTSLNASYTYNRDAVDLRNATVSLSNGYIVGRSTLTEMNSDVQPYVCYDRICPNCYSESSINKALSLKDGGFAECSRCKRVYDLNNFGIISSDTTGVKLERYHVSALGNTLQIYN